jgi:hypothetical protein
MSEFISDEVYAKWTEQWRELEHHREAFDFFKSGEKLLLGDFFDSSDMETLFSTAGITTVKVRLGYEKDKNAFKVILFGVDSVGEMLTPYYAHTPGDFREIGGGGPGGNVPDVLANQWKKYWADLGYAGDITNQRFMTHYGFLNGYNYPVKELINALFKFKKLPQIYIGFVLHKYYPVDRSDVSAVDKPEAVYTFGLLFQAVSTNNSGGTEKEDVTGESDSSYYDLSAPCPRTC